MKRSLSISFPLIALVPCHAQYEAVILPAAGTHIQAEAIMYGTIAGHSDERIPLVWTAPSYLPLRLSRSAGAAMDTSGSQVGGYLREGQFLEQYRAAIWTMSGARPTQTVLHSYGGFYGSTRVYGMDESSQVGRGSFFEPGWSEEAYHALLWKGSAASVVSLHPVESVFRTSWAMDVDDDIQVGSVTTYYPFVGGERQAVMWRGSPQSMRILHPTGAYSSYAVAICGDVIVGFYSFGNDQPILWRANEQGFTLLPLHTGSWFAERGWALDTNGTVHVGYTGRLQGGHGGGIEYRAAAWTGDPATLVDLHGFLPGYIQDSAAEGIDSEGNIVGRGFSGTAPTYAILWKRIVR